MESGTKELRSRREMPKIFLIGKRRCGKTSIAKVVFEKMSPSKTLFLESATNVNRGLIENSNLIQFEIWDIPGPFDSADPAKLSARDFFDKHNVDFSKCNSLVYIIDSQEVKLTNQNGTFHISNEMLKFKKIFLFGFVKDDFLDSLQMLHSTIKYSHQINPNIHFEVFIHKVDGLVDSMKIETRRDIHQRVADRLISDNLNEIKIRYHLTSIYDYTVFESFSKVVQKLVPQLAALESLLNIFNKKSNVDKSFLFDLNAKIYLATDSQTVDIQNYELCCDMIDVFFNFSYIYGPYDDDSKLEPIDDDSCSIMKLNDDDILYLRQIDKCFALVFVLKEENFKRTGILEYNFLCLKDSIKQIFDVKTSAAGRNDGHFENTDLFYSMTAQH